MLEHVWGKARESLLGLRRVLLSFQLIHLLSLRHPYRREPLSQIFHEYRSEQKTRTGSGDYIFGASGTSGSI